jgi:hypothetical protein
MGVLAGLAMRQGVQVVLLNLSPRLRDLVQTLGLDQVARAFEAGQAPADFLPLLEKSRRMRALTATSAGADGTAEMMLEAHETLVGISPDNLPRFKDVLAYLREDIERKRRESGAS